MKGHYRLHSLTASLRAHLLDDEARRVAQEQAGEWYWDYVDTSHDLADALEAHRLFAAAGAAERAGGIALDLGETLDRFGLYDVWRALCDETIRHAPERLVAGARQHLGVIAQNQGDYAEARRQYGESAGDLRSGWGTRAGAPAPCTSWG